MTAQRTISRCIRACAAAQDGRGRWRHRYACAAAAERLGGWLRTAHARALRAVAG